MGGRPKQNPPSSLLLLLNFLGPGRGAGFLHHRMWGSSSPSQHGEEGLTWAVSPTPLHSGDSKRTMEDPPSTGEETAGNSTQAPSPANTLVFPEIMVQHLQPSLPLHLVCCLCSGGGEREGLGLALCRARRVQRQRGRRAPRTQEPPASPLPAKALAAVRLEREASWLPGFLPWPLKAQDPSQEKEQELPSPQEKPPRVPRGGRQRPSSRSAGRQQALLVDSAKAVPLEGVGSGNSNPNPLSSTLTPTPA